MRRIGEMSEKARELMRILTAAILRLQGIATPIVAKS
jgi:hypothetical protein